MNIWLLISGDIFEPCKAEIRSWHWLGMKRKVEEEDPEDGQRTIRRKARENRKTQQGMWFYMKRLILKFNLYHLFVYYLSDFDDWLSWSDWVKTHAQEKGFMDVKVIPVFSKLLMTQPTWEYKFYYNYFPFNLNKIYTDQCCFSFRFGKNNFRAVHLGKGKESNNLL